MTHVKPTVFDNGDDRIGRSLRNVPSNPGIRVGIHRAASLACIDVVPLVGQQRIVGKIVVMVNINANEIGIAVFGQRARFVLGSPSSGHRPKRIP